MYIKSSFPVQAKVPECNAYEALWSRHEQAECPDDLILHIGGASGEKRTYQEFRTRVDLAATTLDKPLSRNAEMIAIISHNSPVRVRERFLSTEVLFTMTSRTVLHLSIPCFLRHRSFCSIHAGTLGIRECLEFDQTDPTVRAGSTISYVRPNGRENSRGKYLHSRSED